MKLAARNRFNRLRKVMGWRWKDIDAITGLKNSRTNSSKKVPGRTILALEVYDRCERVLQNYIVSSIINTLEKDWKVKITAEEYLTLVRYDGIEKRAYSLGITYIQQGIQLQSESKSLLDEIVVRFEAVCHTTVESLEDEYCATVIIDFDGHDGEFLVRLAKSRNSFM